MSTRDIVVIELQRPKLRNVRPPPPTPPGFAYSVESFLKSHDIRFLSRPLGN